MSGNTLSLKVIEAYTRDVGRGVARIGYDSMDALNASTGDVIEIKGKKRTVAKCLPLYPSDEGKGIIRIDGLGRNNSGIAIGDTITVRKVDAVAAEKVVVAPLKPIPPIDERYLTDALEAVSLIKGDNVMVPYFGGAPHVPSDRRHAESRRRAGYAYNDLSHSRGSQDGDEPTPASSRPPGDFEGLGNGTLFPNYSLDRHSSVRLCLCHRLASSLLAVFGPGL